MRPKVGTEQEQQRDQRAGTEGVQSKGGVPMPQTEAAQVFLMLEL